MHHPQELGRALLVASPRPLPERLEPWRVVAVTVSASLAPHVAYGGRPVSWRGRVRPQGAPGSPNA